MRIERWYWLIAFCMVSLCIHLGLVYRSRAFAISAPYPVLHELEVALQPLPEPKPAPKPELKPKPPTPEPKAKPERRPAALARAERSVPPAPVAVKRKETLTDLLRVRAPKVVAENRPVRAKVEPGGMDLAKEEKPLPFGLPGRPQNEAPRLLRVPRADPVPGGGGAPAPAPIPGGHGGARGPEAPPEDIQYNGGGAGGQNLPKVAPRLGGGGGRSLLSVENPLAKETVPDEKPGLGPGVGRGEGAGGQGGVGYGRGRGIGTRLDGTDALATLRRKPGAGIGAAQGDKIGTRPPGGGKGSGAELPGTGGAGLGYGRGRGIGIGNGGGVGIGHGNGGGGIGLNRGIPFGDITGLLNGDPKGGSGAGGGPGGSGRGGVFGARPRTGRGGNGPVHIVYLLDSSGSMADGDKIGKAKEALKKALSELKPKDSFDIIHFDRKAHPFSPTLVPATKENIAEANDYVDAIELRPFTNLSGALEMALQMEGITHIFVLSDGEPHGGIEDPDELRQMVRTLNTQKAQIITLALGLGENFPGMALLKGIAEDNNGRFSYVNLAKDDGQ
jgi:hypothetical protein